MASPCSILHTASNQKLEARKMLHNFGRRLVRVKLRTVSATVCGRLSSKLRTVSATVCGKVSSKVHNLHVHQPSC